jgi:DNA-binding transcriptional LysR family regulator
VHTVELASLEIFKAVVEHGGVNKAAAALHRVPSNVTARVKQLEEQLGTALFLRDGRRLVLSAEGKVLLAYANELLRLSAEAAAAVQKGRPQGTFRLGSLESTAAARLSPILSKYHAMFPDVKVELVTGTSGALVSRLHAQEIEAALVAEPFTATGLESQVAFREEIVLITAKGQRPIKRPKDIGNLTVIAFTQGCSYRKRLETWLATDHVQPSRIMEFQSYHAIVACVAAGSGIAAIPRSVLEATPAARQVAVYPLPPMTAKAKTHLVWRPGYRSIALDAFKALLPSNVELRRAA